MKVFLMILYLTAVCYPFTADEILDRNEENENFRTSVSFNIEEVYNPGGSLRVSEMKAYSQNGDEKVLLEYIEPKKVKGMKILMLNNGDDIWFYSNRTNRVRKIAAHQKKQSANNSDFSYQDMSMSDYRKDYSYKLEGEEKRSGRECFRISFSAKQKDAVYSRFTLWIDKTDYYTFAGEFFDETGRLWKMLEVKNVKKTGKYWTAGEIEMKNVQKNSRTVVKTKDIMFDIELPEEMFTERGLKR
ncbi:MAG TPA: outer membrane lipoprotein-sorting protein [Clostridiales bacterium]|jgi:outer membrane lipoprotein-sorting protein|nr:outer membrane lipoprotein-sorting protein [Clostridiales bacterium]HQP69726.1 outer membrane lipoprotein-sorting protein [Clostridiales bacterium]